MKRRTMLAMALLAAGLRAAPVPQAGAQTPQAAVQTLKIGIIGPLTGGGAPWGIAMREAASIRAAAANADGGLSVGDKTYRVQIVAYDDQYKAAEAVAVYNRLVNQDGVRFVILLTSASTLAVKDSVEDDKVLALTAGFTAKAIDAGTRYMYRLSSTPANYAGPLAAWLASNIRERRVAIVNPNDETGWDTARVDEQALTANGFQVIGNELFDRAQRDFQPLLTKVIATAPDIIDVGTTPPATAGLMIRQARDLGYKGLFLKTGGPGPREILEAAGSQQAVEGMIAMDFANPGAPGYQTLAGEYRKSIGQEPNHMIAPYYDAVNVLFRAVQKAGTVDDPARVAAALPAVLPTPSVEGGNLSYGDRQILSPIFVTRMQAGEAVVVGKVDIAG